MNPAIPFINDHPLAEDTFGRARILYTDLDGTLLGQGGSVLVDGDGGFSTTTVSAIVRVNEARLPVVICSGRNRIQLAEVARLLGWRGFIAELGCVIVPDRGADPIYNTGDWPDDALLPDETPFAAIARVGALDVLRAAFPGRLEDHAPHHLNREATYVLRGNVDAPSCATNWPHSSCPCNSLTTESSTRRTRRSSTSTRSMRTTWRLPAFRKPWPSRRTCPAED